MHRISATLSVKVRSGSTIETSLIVLPSPDRSFDADHRLVPVRRRLAASASRAHTVEAGASMLRVDAVVAGGHQQRPHAVVAGVVLDLSETEVLEHRGNVVAEAPSVPLAQPVPAPDGVVGRAGPGLDGAGPGRWLLVRVAQVHPVAVLRRAWRAGPRCSRADRLRVVEPTRIINAEGSAVSSRQASNSDLTRAGSSGSRDRPGFRCLRCDRTWWWTPVLAATTDRSRPSGAHHGEGIHDSMCHESVTSSAGVDWGMEDRVRARGGS